VGQNLGAGKEVRAIRSGWITVVYDTIANLVLIAAVFTVGQRILRVFDDDPAPVAIATQYLYTVAPSYLCLGVGVVLGNAMAGAGATRTTMWVDVAVILGFQFPLCILAVAGLGVQQETLFRCVAATNVVSAGAYALVYLRGGWRRSALGHTILAKAPVS
jgi:MATE family multidrug resistance protein